MNVFGENIITGDENMVFRLRPDHQTTECRVGGAKFSKTKETAIF